MKYGSVCSGIEAASAAWHPLGWQAAWFSEIEPFPCSVLKHHYPDVPNLGDMTKWETWPDEPIDVLVGGTPCQSFSVAGLRQGLADPRGGLMLQFLGIADRYKPRWVVWENVPGVLSSNGGRDFGTFLGALGELGYGWAYRVLDAQWFGVAQRRRRVFVVGCLGDQRSAAAVLFERESLCRDSAKGGKARERIAGTLSSRATAGGGLGTDFDLAGGLQVVPPLTARMAKGRCTDGQDEQASYPHLICMAHGQGGAEIRENSSPTLTCNHEAPIIAGVQRSTPAWVQCPEECGDYWCNIHQQHTGDCECPPIDEWVTDPYGMQLEGPAAKQPIVLMDQGGSVMNTLTDGTVGTLRREMHGHEPVVAFPANLSGTQCASTEGVACNLQAKNPTAVAFAQNQVGGHEGNPTAIAVRTANTSANGHGISPELAHTLDQAQGQAVAIGTDCYNGAITGDVAATMGTHGSSSNSSGPTVMQTVAPPLTASNDPSRSPQSSEVTQQVAAVHRAVMQVRRLTPTECERLQGFPDGYTQVPYRNKPAADGPRYKALGNSMAVPVMAWIGRRIQMVEDLIHD